MIPQQRPHRPNHHHPYRKTHRAPRLPPQRRGEGDGFAGSEDTVVEGGEDDGVDYGEELCEGGGE